MAFTATVLVLVLRPEARPEEREVTAAFTALSLNPLGPSESDAFGFELRRNLPPFRVSMIPAIHSTASIGREMFISPSLLVATVRPQCLKSGTIRHW